MKVFEATYAMGDIATGGYFKSFVVANEKSEVKRLLNETLSEDVSGLVGVGTEGCYVLSKHAQVLTTSRA